MQTLILVYLTANQRPDPSLSAAGDVAILSSHPKVQGDICDLGGDLVFLLGSFPKEPGLWVWSGTFSEETDQENYRLSEWRRLTTQELIELGAGRLWVSPCA